MIRRRDDGVLIDVLVQPRASRAAIGPVTGDRLKVAVTAPPVDGKANAAVVAVVAKALGVPRGRVQVVRGASSRRKTVSVDGVTQAGVLALIDRTRRERGARGRDAGAPGGSPGRPDRWSAAFDRSIDTPE